MQKHIKIQAISALQDNYIWAIIDTNHKKVTIVDPGEAEPVLAFLEQQELNLQSILVTHHHWDHTHGVAELKQHFRVPVFGAHNSEFKEITHRLEDGAYLPPLAAPLHFQALSIPGHTLDHLAYYAPGVLFCGDTLFACGCGRIFEGSAQQMYQSLQKLAALPKDTNIYCGHEYTLKNLRFAETVDPENLVIQRRIQEVGELINQGQPSLPSSLETEMQTNPFLRCELSPLQAHAERYAGISLNTPEKVFTWLRKAKDEFRLKTV